MKSNQKLLIMFWLKKSKTTKDGQAPLYARITIDGKDEEIAVSRKCKPQFWDTDIKRVTESSADARITNLRIAEIELNLQRQFIVLQSQHDAITPLMLKNAFLGLPVNFDKSIDPVCEKVERKLLEVLSDFIEKFEKQVEKKKRSYETLKHWRSTKTKIAAFISFQYAVEDILLSEIKYSFAEKYYDYMTLEVNKPLSELSAKGQIKKLKQILTGCVTKEYISKNPIQGFKCSGGDKDVMPLEMEQIQRIYFKEFSVKRLEEVKDAFIFQCFTGFAYQDVYALSKDNIIKVGNNGELWLIKDRGKTDVSEMVPILPIAKEIIDKYADHPYCIENNCLLPINSNARYNGYLKEIADICGIVPINKDDRELGSHKARHTFADMMLNNGVPLEDVSKMLGHKSIRTTQRYCRVRKNRISENMAKVKSILFTVDGQLKEVS
ncbi:site-specific integrase [Pedobacter sp. ISL-68]|uniref:site-specific integrase n=1 Tax=unclassified Pedobacter TaxID=2628915 RepID=UPI001BEBD49C|nr:MULTISPECIES: site-specific integrase [unclassified Pedobacter]MBT2561283.1 site-specific integrase [Pedobacter sp. ISL-64]MBT2590672.1 site-specific integrase [Pedobacter sp. ISL-68]